VTSQTSGDRRRNATAARIAGTLAVLGVAAAIAGLGTFGSFTTSSTPVGTAIDSGVLSITLSDAGDSLSMPFGGVLFLAGDSRSYRVDLVNDGNTALSSLTMTSTATESSVLDADTTNGLQLQVKSCSVPWSVSGTTYTCGATERSFYSGPIVVANQTLANAASLTAGQTEHLLLTASLPSSASADALEGASSSLSFVFSGTQRGGSPR
jgi:hypothetical protein